MGSLLGWADNDFTHLNHSQKVVPVSTVGHSLTLPAVVWALTCKAANGALYC